MVEKQRPTESEIEILSVLWNAGPATVRDVHTELVKGREVGYTTLLKLMQIMTEKGLLVRDESNRSHVYRPKQRAEMMQRSIVRGVIDKVFSGATEQLVLQALSTKKATPEQIAQIREMLDQIQGEKR